MDENRRWKQRLSNFRRATDQLTEFLSLPQLNKFEKQGLIQCFEYTFELSWKTMKDYLEDEGYELHSPRETIKIAFTAGLLTDGHVFMDALQKRNLMAHTYDESLADQICVLIKERYYPSMIQLCRTLEDL